MEMRALLNRKGSPLSVVRLVVWLWLGTVPGWAASAVSAALQAMPTLDPNLAVFPDNSLYDVSARLDAPAGRHGFVTVKNGHFAFADGTRVRFFGVNLAKDSVFIDRPQIDVVINRFARAGINLVRIHHIDDVTGILGSDGDYFNEDKLAILDYWIARLKARGIYLCLDLNDYRTFRGAPERGLEQLGRGAKPYAVFDQELIRLQIEYARKLLVEHINPHTGLSYARDPAIALLEIYDENGLFIRRNDWPTLREPYLSRLTALWNDWLRQRYGSTEMLYSAWVNYAGQPALRPDESLETGTVRLPKMALDAGVAATITDPLRAPVRVSAGALFAHDLQTTYLQTMMRALRGMGIRIPITAVGAQDILPDLIATAATTDFIGINFYWDHPLFDPGREWTPPFYFAMNNPLTDNPNYAFPTTVSLARMHDKPLVVRELGYCYPNPYRGMGMIEAAAYGAMLDLDAIFLFTYGADSTARTIGYFDIHLDPLRWGLIAQAARLFLSGEVLPATTTVGIGYSGVDAFTWYQYLNALYQLAFTTRVVNYAPSTPEPHPFDLLVASGRSSGSRWTGERQLLLANFRHNSLQFQAMEVGLVEFNGYNLLTGRSGTLPFAFFGMGYDQDVVKSLPALPVFSTQDVMANGLQPLAMADTATLGFLDPKRRVLGFHNLTPDLAVRFAVDALQTWRKTPMTHRELDRGRWISTTRQLVRDTAARRLIVETPTLQALVGRLDGSATNTSLVRLATATPIGTFTVESLDGRPLDQSTSLLMKMTSVARNDLMRIEQAPTGPKPRRLTALGVAPIRTDGRPTATPTRLLIGGKRVIDLYLQNGTWEYLTAPDRALLYVDTGDVRVVLPATPKEVRWHTGGPPLIYTPDSPSLTIPPGVRMTEIVWQ